MTQNVIQSITNVIYPDKGRALGPDLSRWELTYDPDLAKNKASFVFTKATEGITWVDPALDNIWRGMLKISVRGLYHYQRSGMSWKTQADHFLSISANYDVHMLALDVETVNNTLDKSFFSDSYRILNYLEERTDKLVLLYTGQKLFEDYLYPMWSNLFGVHGVSKALTVPLWLAQYWFIKSPNKEPGLPKQRKNWDFWQWSDSEPSSDWGAGAKAVDVNAYNGSEKDLYNRLNISQVIEEPKPPVVNPPIELTPIVPETEERLWEGYVISSSRMNVRNYPKIDSTNLTGLYVLPREIIRGRLWSGNGYLWMRMELENDQRSGLWVAVRTLDGAAKFVTLRGLSTPTTVSIVSTGNSLWRVMHDIEIGKVWRAGLPQVHPLFPAPSEKSGSHYSPFQRWAQEISYKANPTMTRELWSKIYWHNYWMTNYQGFGMTGDPRANWIELKDLDKSLPKCESLTCGGSLIEGIQEGNWVRVIGLHYSNEISFDYLRQHPQFWTRGTYASSTGQPFRMLGHKFTGSALIHPLLVDQKYNLYIQTYKLQKWTSSELPDPLKLYTK